MELRGEATLFHQAGYADGAALRDVFLLRGVIGLAVRRFPDKQQAITHLAS